MAGLSVERDVIEQLTRIADSLVGTAEIPINVPACLLASTGAPLAVFADGASATPGVQITSSETWGVRWNNNATQTAIATNVFLPSDIDTSYPITFYADVFKVGATAADATTFTVGAFLHAVGSLITADADAGGATNALDGDLTSLTIQRLSRVIAASDVAAALALGGPGALSLSFGPTAGTLATDDLVVVSAWLEYTRRAT